MQYAYDNQTMVLNKKINPLTQQKISIELGMSKAKVDSIICDWQKNEYIFLGARGRYALLEKGSLVVEGINKIEAKMKKYSQNEL